jgi:hypothetical protein
MMAIMKEDSVLQDSASSTLNTELRLLACYSRTSLDWLCVEVSSLTTDEDQINSANILGISGTALRLLHNNFRGALGEYSMKRHSNAENDD